jgi:hypothetical protein
MGTLQADEYFPGQVFNDRTRTDRPDGGRTGGLGEGSERQSGYPVSVRGAGVERAGRLEVGTGEGLVTTDGFLSLVQNVRVTPRGWIGRCPAHQDKSPSLSIREEDNGQILLHCFAGCPTDEVCAALGLTLRDLFPPTHADPASIRRARAQREEATQQRVRAQRLDNVGADAQREAQRLIASAKNLAIDHWTDAFLNVLMNKLADAYELIGACDGTE